MVWDLALISNWKTHPRHTCIQSPRFVSLLQPINIKSSFLVNQPSCKVLFKALQSQTFLVFIYRSYLQIPFWLPFPLPSTPPPVSGSQGNISNLNLKMIIQAYRHPQLPCFLQVSLQVKMWVKLKIYIKLKPA